MKITANMKECEVAEGTTVVAFIESAGLNPSRCVAELNGAAMTYEKFKDAVLKDGDVLEIMTVVAGG